MEALTEFVPSGVLIVRESARVGSVTPFVRSLETAARVHNATHVVGRDGCAR